MTENDIISQLLQNGWIQSAAEIQPPFDSVKVCVGFTTRTGDEGMIFVAEKLRGKDMPLVLVCAPTDETNEDEATFFPVPDIEAAIIVFDLDCRKKRGEVVIGIDGTALTWLDEDPRPLGSGPIA
jgi:hypothetical protein